MSSSTRPADGRIAAGHGIAWARAALVAGYAVLAHVAQSRHDGRLAAVALGLLALCVLVQALARGNPRAWALLGILALALTRLAGSPQALLPLLLVPPALIGLAGWGFARTLRRGRTPLITGIAQALEGPLAPDVDAYTRRLTAVWALLLLALALANLALAALLVPHGLLAGLGRTSPLPIGAVPHAWITTLGNYAILVGLLWGEFRYRQRRFPPRFAGFAAFLRSMAGLGPAFWRRALLGG